MAYSPALLLLLCAIFGLAAAGRPFTATDLVEISRVGNPAAGPDGKTYVFNLRTWNQDTNKVTTNLWYGTVNSNVYVLNALDNVTDYSYVWAKDGSAILFLSNRAGSTQLWGVSFKSGKFGTPYQISNFPVDIDNLKISHDGKYVAFSAQVYPGMSMQQTANEDALLATSRVNAQYWDHLFIRRWDTWWMGKYNHLFYAGISLDSSASKWKIGSATDIMLNYASDCPSRPFGGPEEFDFSFDSKEIAFTTQVGNDIAWSTDLNVYTCSIPSLTITCLTCDNKATDTQPAYSPDGKYLAYLSMVIPQYESDRLRVKLYNRSTKTITSITDSWERSPSTPMWSDDSTAIYAIVPDEARNRLYKISVPSGTPSVIIADHDNQGFDIIPCLDGPSYDCFIVAQSNLMRPADMYLTSHSGTVTQMTWFNQDRLSQIDFSAGIEFHYPGADNDDVMGWVFKPYGYVEGKKYPLVVYIHGGPEDSWYDEFHYRWNPQTITAAGYALFAPNPHGSNSFGDAYCQAILTQWGGKPYEDIMLGVDAVGAAFSWIDTKNVGAMGASYGGFMINWLNSQTTRFKCLICHDGVFDPMSEYYFTDELYFNEMEFGDAPFIDREYYDMWSPLAYAANMVTPQLTFHGGMDFRIPDVSGISAFTVLQRKGIPSVLIRFPDENHWVQDPNNSLYWHEQVLAWLQRWLQP